MRSGWVELSGGWKVAFALALAWLPLSTVIILMTTAAGEPLPSPLRLLRALASLVAFGVVVLVARRVLSGR